MLKEMVLMLMFQETALKWLKSLMTGNMTLFLWILNSQLWMALRQPLKLLKMKKSKGLQKHTPIIALTAKKRQRR